MDGIRERIDSAEPNFSPFQLVAGEKLLYLQFSPKIFPDVRKTRYFIWDGHPQWSINATPVDDDKQPRDDCTLAS